MKKFLKFGSCALILVLLLVFIGCGSTKKADNCAGSNAVTESATLTKDGKYTSVSAYLNSEAVQKELKSTLESNQNSMFDIDVSAKDNQLIYTYTYKTITKQDGMKDTLDQGLEQQKSTFIQIAKVLAQCVDVKNPCVVIRYIDSNKELIAERTFTPEG